MTSIFSPETGSCVEVLPLCLKQSASPRGWLGRRRTTTKGWTVTKRHLPTLNPHKWNPQGNCPICFQPFLSSRCRHSRGDIAARLSELRDVRALLDLADKGARRV
jgi:hypothetical protein